VNPGWHVAARAAEQPFTPENVKQVWGVMLCPAKDNSTRAFQRTMSIGGPGEPGHYDFSVPVSLLPVRSVCGPQCRRAFRLWFLRLSLFHESSTGRQFDTQAFV
jgi:hypothetical protein